MEIAQEARYVSSPYQFSISPKISWLPPNTTTNNSRLIVRERGEPYSTQPTSWTRGLVLGASEQIWLSSDFWAWLWSGQAITRRAQPGNPWLFGFLLFASAPRELFCPFGPSFVSSSNKLWKEIQRALDEDAGLYGRKKIKTISNFTAKRFGQIMTSIKIHSKSKLK